MTESAAPNAAPAEGQPPVAPPTAENGNVPDNNGNGSSNQGITDFDPSKLSDEQINKVLEDQRLWKTQRLSDLREQAKKGKEYETEKAKIAQEAAIKKGDFDKVLAEKDAQIQQLTEKLNNGQLDNTLRDALNKAGVKNLPAGLKLIDRANLNIGDNGQIEGLDEAVKQFTEQYPEFVSINNTSVGSPTNPSNIPSGQPVKMSDMRNPVWFNNPANAEIIRQVQLGKVQVVSD